MSQTAVSWIWRASASQPHRVKTFKLFLQTIDAVVPTPFKRFGLSG
jgi:hypothetical protein